MTANMIPTSNQEGLDILSRIECQDSTFTAAIPPVVLSRGLGSILYDCQDRPYIDMCAGFGALCLGHNHPSYRQTWQELLSGSPPLVHGAGDVAPNWDKIELLQTMKRLAPAGFDRISLALTGSQAVEIAIKTALLHQKKSGFIAFDDGYHGVDLSALALTDRADFRQGFEEWLPGDRVIHLPLHCSLQMVKEAILTLERHHGFAAMIIEPIQGRAGMKVVDLGWMEELCTIAHSNHGLMILDEIFTGLGRIGTLSTAHQISADLITWGKALGGGMPMSACLGSENVMSSWPKSHGEATHTGTFFGHPLSCRIANITLKQIEQQNLDQRCQVMGAKIQQFFESRLSPAKVIVRGQGLFKALMFPKALQGTWVADRLREKGVFAIPCGNQGQGLSLTPAYNIPEPVLNDALETIHEVIQSVN